MADINWSAFSAPIDWSRYPINGNDPIDWDAFSARIVLRDNCFFDWDATREPIAWTIYDYDLMKIRRGWMPAEIRREILHPRRIRQWIEAGNDVETYRADLVEDNIF